MKRYGLFALLLCMLSCLGSPCRGTDFDGVDDRVMCPDSASFDSVFTTAQARTVAVWIRGTSTATQVVCEKGSSSHCAMVRSGSTGLNWRISTIACLAIGVTFTDGEWHHLVGIYDGSTTLLLYVDGAYNKTASDASPGANNFSVTIGGKYTGLYPFMGQIDDFRIYNRAFSAAEVEALYRLTRNTAGKKANGALANGLIAHYKMRDGPIGIDVSGTGTIKDATANANHGDGVDGADGSLVVTAPAVK